MKSKLRDPKIAQYMSLPWTLLVTHDEEDGYVVRVEEMPDAIGTGDTPAELEKDFWDSLAESIRVRLMLGDPIPLPPTARPHPQTKSPAVGIPGEGFTLPSRTVAGGQFSVA